MKKLVSLVVVLILSACLNPDKALIAQDSRDPVKNFDYLWKTFDRNYAIFGHKKVDWKALYKIYRPKVTSETSEDELFDIMAKMLGHLNDNHVRLISPNRRFSAGLLNNLRMEDFSLELVKTKYLSGKFRQKRDTVFHYGWLSDSIGYFHFRGFGNLKASSAAIDEIINEFKDASGIIVDVRQNGGGDDMVGKAIADRFADRKRLYMTTQIRKGPRHTDLTPPRYWYVEPGGPIQFTKPVVLLTHRFSVSAADNFALAMRVLPHVTVVGDFTSGCYADQYGDRLPNGWRFSVSFKLFLDYKGFCWEGIGVPPDLKLTNTSEDIDNDRDNVLEFAMSLIDSGEMSLQDESGSTRNFRESLVFALGKAIDDKGVDEAIREFNVLKHEVPDRYYLDCEEMWILANKLLDSGKSAEAGVILDLIFEEFPDEWSLAVVVPSWENFLRSGQKEMSDVVYRKALEIKPRFPWEVSLQERAKKAVSQ